MAKPQRGGLGRGLNSLLGNNNEVIPPAERTKDRDVIIYDENEDYNYNATPELYNKERRSEPGKTGRLGVVGNPRETNSSQVENVSRETIKEPEPVVIEKVVEKIVEKEPDNIENLILEIPIDKVQPNPDQPRTNFNEEDLKELASSIKREGIIQPILVRQLEDGNYQIIAGERRYQASKLAGKETVTVQVKDVSDEKALELALIENIQRTDLNPIEEAYGYKRLMERNKMTQADIAQAVSKGRSTIANALRLLELPEEAQQLLFEDKITAGHARAILSVPTKEGRAQLTNKLAENKLSVRETENLARLMANKPGDKPKREPLPAVYKSVARSLKTSLDTNVKVKSSKGKNKIEIEFKDEKDLERIFELISPE